MFKKIATLGLVFTGLFTVSNAQIITTVVGNGTQGFSGDGGLATSAELKGPASVIFDAIGNMYIADAVNNRIRKVGTNGIITTIAGSALGPGYGGDGGPATSASLNNPSAISFDRSGNLYIADAMNNMIRKVDTAGIITTIAGICCGGGFYNGDGGLAIAAALNAPNGVCVDTIGNVYITDTDNHRIRKVDTSGIITTIAGNGNAVFSGDGGPAVVAEINTPVGIGFDTVGNLYFSEAGNNRIRKINSSGIITTVAGNGTSAFAGDGGLATTAALNDPLGIAFDPFGNLYIADQANSRIRMINSLGVISTVAGNGTQGFSGDNGPATAAELFNAGGVACDLLGNLYIADYGANRVRKVNNTNATKEIISENVQIEVWPNPTAKILNIKKLRFNRSVELKIINMLGVEQQTLNSENAKEVAQIDVSNLVDGIYFVVIYYSNNRIEKKIVISH